MRQVAPLGARVSKGDGWRLNQKSIDPDSLTNRGSPWVR
jgi:hypothetical protein